MLVDTVGKYYASQRNFSISVGHDRTQGQMQLYTKCGGNAILSLLSANIAEEVISRNSFGEISNRFAIMNRVYKCYRRNEGNPKRDVCASWIHNFLPPSGKNDESYQESVLDDTECEYFPSKHNVSTCLERHTLRVELHCIPYMSIVIFHRLRL